MRLYYGWIVIEKERPLLGKYSKYVWVKKRIIMGE
jgi:hypothetical protein